ncbi:MAG: HD domain-containing protein [Candidatus Omnitrophica bacterium]|nr:HD domain-containing protein [Candidatus Omnitrophota bacterium]
MNVYQIFQIIQGFLVNQWGIFVFLLGLFIGFIIYRIKAKFVFKAYSSIVEKTKIQDRENKELLVKLKELGNSLNKSELEEKLWHQEETEFIFKLQENISLEFDRKIVSRYIVDGVGKFFNAKKVALLLADNSDELRIEQTSGFDSEKVRELVLKKGESISGFVLARKEPIKVDDLKSEPYLLKKNKESYFTNEFISVPILSRHRVLGVINICGRNIDKTFSKKDVALASSVGRVCGIAFEGIFLYDRLEDSYLKMITALAQALDARDSYTKRHSENVTRYSSAIAKEMKLSLHQQEVLVRAALLHDLGKIGISDAVLLKPGKLTAEEFAQIKEHPLKGYEIVQSLSFLKESANLILHHHERFDGKGYPQGIKGIEIELGARILAVADSFDAMTTDRPYRPAMSVDQAVSELIKSKANQLDPEIVDCFIKVLKNNPAIV